VRPLLIMVAVSAMATMPCLLLLLVSLDGVFDRAGRVSRRLRTRWHHAAGFTWRQRRRLARLDRTLVPAAAVEVPVAWPPIERIAMDLRRLRRQRTGIALRSPVWFAAVEKAYDDRLRLGCERLGIDEHLDELAGVDREIERVRLEGALEAAGIQLRGCETASS
jgi:hypothetical protein